MVLISAIDALLVINQLGRVSSGNSGSGESEHDELLGGSKSDQLGMISQAMVAVRAQNLDGCSTLAGSGGP